MVWSDRLPEENDDFLQLIDTDLYFRMAHNIVNGPNLSDEDNSSEPFDRNKAMLVQTPQTFQSKILLPAFNTEYKDGFTDEATVAEASGVSIHLTEGEVDNIKITRPVDLLIAEKILEERGHGS